MDEGIEILEVKSGPGNGPRTPDGSGPRTPNKRGPMTPEHRGPRTPDGRGPRTPERTGPRTPDGSGPRTPELDLPVKLHDCKGKILLCSHSLKAGIVKTENQSGPIYCVFSYRNLHLPENAKFENMHVYCDAWLMKQSAFIPYMASVVWREDSPPQAEQKQRILGNPNPADQDFYAQVAEDMSRILKEEDENSHGYEDRKSHKKHKKQRRRSRSRDRKRSRSGDRHRSHDRDDKYRDRKKHKRDHSRERSKRNKSSKERRFKEESPERKHRDYSPDDEEQDHHDEYYRGRSSFRGRMRGRMRMMRGGTGVTPAPSSKAKLAIGRNVFPSDEETEGQSALPAPMRGRGRGRFVRIGRGALPGLKLKKLVHGEDVSTTPVPTGDDRPGLGFSGGGQLSVRDNARWRRWQQLSRSGKDEEGNGGSVPRDGSPGSGGSELDEYGANAESLKKPIKKYVSRSKSPVTSGVNGLRVSVLTYENEEVGILSGPKETKVLFHINQVWIKHPSAGFSPFTEIYPTGDLSKHFYPGREVSCHIREIPKTRDVKGQAEAVWLQGFPPEPALFRFRELPAELNFHLAQYQSGKCGKLEMVLSVDKHSSLEGTVQEYVSFEMGVVRLMGKEGACALFHLDQVWIYEDRNWVLFKDVIKSPLSFDYLPIGSVVSLSVRKLPCSAYSHLRYQAMVIWNKELCRHREARAPPADSWSMFTRRGLEDGQVPPGYIHMYSLPENHLKLIKTLDVHFDNFKKLGKLDLKNMNAVPVLLNLLPPMWEAKVYKVVDDENGVIIIKHRRGGNLTDDPKLRITKMFAIFHVDDVYTGTGEKFRKSPSEFMLQLHGQEVDLTARSIVGEGAYEGVFTAASQLNLSLMNPNVACPVLQAVTVFIKTTPEAEPNIRLAPKPTFLRVYPDSFHAEHSCTAFFLNCELLIKLDLKTLNFFNATNQARMQKEIINGIPMAYFHQMKKSVSTDKQEQIKLIQEMSLVDVNKTSGLVYGSYRELPQPPIRPNYPSQLTNVTCSPRLLYQQGLFAKEGVILCEIPTPSGHRIAVYAFFDMSNYKFSISKELRIKNFADNIPIFSSPSLKAHIILINSNNPIPYIATAVWNPVYWNRSPDNQGKMDDIFLQKYERLTTLITNKPGTIIPVTSLPPPSVHGSAKIQNIPNQAQHRQPPPPRLLWANKPLLREVVGRVTSIIDENYGLAVVKFAGPPPTFDRNRAIVLFDTCDLWVGEHTATELNMNLNQCLREGDYIKVKALLVPESENLKNIRYLATGVVTGRTKTEVRNIPLPEQERLENIDRIHPDKLNNFYQVVSVVCANIPGDAEEEAQGVSTDEDSLPKTKINFGGAGSNPAPYSQDGQFSRSSMMSMDAFEEEREKKKNAKALECSNARRKMGYSKDAREKLLAEMKLANQLMWKCTDCQISCAKPGMEKHLQLKTHWDKVLENYSKKLDAMRPNPVF